MAALAARQGPGGAAAAAIRPLPLPSAIALCQPTGGPGMAVRKRPVRWRRSQPRMQSIRRPLPSALPVAKVKGSGSSRRLRPLRLHLLSLCVSRTRHRRDHRPTPPGQQTLLTATGPAPTSAGPHCSQRLRHGTTPPIDPAHHNGRFLSSPLSPGAVDQARPRPVLAYQPDTGAVQSPSPKPTVTPPLPSRGCPE